MNSFPVETLGEGWDDSVKRTHIVPRRAVPIEMKIQCDVENLVFGGVLSRFLKDCSLA
jgi:hypothetical protein